jgi:2-methylcitrate dehydratase PrpD
MTSQNDGVTRKLAQFVVKSRLEDLPRDVVHEGERAFVNWLGCVYGGCNMPPIDMALPLLDEFSGPREATVIGRDKSLDIFGAAFLNSMSNAARSYNDTHLSTVAHPTASVAAALLALAERRPVSGAEFIHALIMGVEVQCRIGLILTTEPARSHYALSMIALAGGIGAAVAVAKLLKFDEQRTIYALALAAAQAGGTRATHGSSGGRMLSGEAARAGLMSALLAERGFDTPDEVLEGPKGFANAHAEHADARAAIAGLGVDYEISNLAYKPYPCGIVVHPVIDVCLDLIREHRFSADDVDQVVLHVPESAMLLTGRKDPTDGNKAGTSIYHWAAASLLHNAAGLAQNATECVLDPRVIALRERVVASADPALAADAARADIHLRDGRILSGRVDHARGSVSRPLTDDELSEKFLGQARLALTEKVSSDLLHRAWHIMESPSVSACLSSILGTR